MENTVLDNIIDEIYTSVEKLLPTVADGYDNHVQRLGKISYVWLLQKIIYVNDTLRIKENLCGPKEIINMSKYIDLSNVLKLSSKLEILYSASNGTQKWIRLELTGFNENNLPVWKVTNLHELISDSELTKSSPIIAMNDFLNTIKSDDNKYLYGLLLSDYDGLEDVDDEEIDDSVDAPASIEPISKDNIKPKLSDNTWEEIIYASENNCIPDTWNIGDEIDLTLSGKYNETVTLQIWDFNHYDKSDRSGKANILFGMKNLMKDKRPMNLSNNNNGGWNDSYMKNTVMNDIYESIPENIRNHIKEVYTYANTGGDYSKDEFTGLYSTDKVFIPGLSEINNEWEKQNITESGQYLIPIFKDKNNRIKKMSNGTESAFWWWTRSPYCYYSGYFCYFNAGGYSYDGSAGYSGGVCVCFNI